MNRKNKDAEKTYKLSSRNLSILAKATKSNLSLVEFGQIFGMDHTEVIRLRSEDYECMCKKLQIKSGGFFREFTSSILNIFSKKPEFKSTNRRTV